ncbi:MAG TPA: LysR family transcriptional regulator, partial [Myxococcaceae bacterium]
MQTMLGMDVFLQVAREGSFSAAAKALGLTPSGVSRIIARLEAHLGVRLLQRTTRAVTLTEEGAAFLQRSERILDQVRDAEEAMRSVRQAARGRVRVDAAMVLSELTVGPALPRFLRSNPEIRVELSVRDQPVDLVRERIDLVLRMAGTAPPAAISRRLGSFRIVTAASPAYLAAHGTPSTPGELHQHTCLSFLLDGRPLP